MQTHTFGTGAKKILIVHGLMESGATYSRLAEELKRDYTVVLADLPGFGESPPSAERPILESYAREITEFINGNEFDLLIGHSLGGTVLIRALCGPALDYKNHIILANTPYMGVPKLKVIAFFWRLNQLLFFLQRKLPIKVAGPIIKLAGRISAKNPDALNEQIIADCHRSDPYTSALLGRELAFDKFRWCTDRHLESVTLFMSEFDEVISNKNLRKLHEDIPGSRVVLFEGIGHMTVLEDYTKFLREVKAVLDG